MADESKGMWEAIQDFVTTVLAPAPTTPEGQAANIAGPNALPYLRAIRERRAAEKAQAANAAAAAAAGSTEGALMGFGAGTRANNLESLIQQTRQ